MRGQNILARVFNKPQLITEQSLQPILDYLESPERSTAIKLTKPDEPKELLRSDFPSDEAYQRKRLKIMGIDPETNIGYLEIKDTLVNREGRLNAECMELTSYEKLKKTFSAQIAEGVKHCVLMVDSGGGEAYGCFEAANHVRKLAKENGVKLTAYVDGMSASAAFAWTVIADEIIANPMAQVGSVGVVIALYNNSRMLKEKGIDRSFVYAGGNKIPFKEDGNFTEKFIADAQDSVDKSYTKFIKHVATNLGISEQAVKDTQASVYDADKAMELGFIHKVMEVEDFSAYLSTNAKANSTVYFSHALDANPSNENKDKINMSDPINTPLDEANPVQDASATVDLPTDAELATDVASLQASVAALTAEKETLTAQLSSHVLQVEDLTKQLSTVTTQFSEYKESVKQEARLTKLTAIFGTESSKPQAYATMFASSDDATFDAVLADFSEMLGKQSASMEELGSAAPVEPVALSSEELTLEAARNFKSKRTTK